MNKFLALLLITTSVFAQPKITICESIDIRYPKYAPFPPNPFPSNFGICNDPESWNAYQDLAVEAPDEVRVATRTNDEVRITHAGSAEVRLRIEDNYHIPNALDYPGSAYVPQNSSMVDSPLGTSSEFKVGATTGSVSVTPIGSAAYTIPLDLPVAAGGQVPSLAVSYNSLGRSGLLGWGWNLAGLSAITRTGQNEYYDGQNTGLQVNSNDRFALDGQRLVATTEQMPENQGGYEGRGGQHFEPELRSNFEVIAHGNSNGLNIPDWFELVREDGTILEYGNSTDGKSTAYSEYEYGNRVLSWHLTKVTDINGNYATYTYTKSKYGLAILTQISYGGNTKNGQVHYNTIDLEYSEKVTHDWHRTDLYTENSTNKAYYTIDKELLRSITVKTNDSQLKRYAFQYYNDGNTTRLQAMFTYLQSDAVFFNVMAFKYEDYIGNTPTDGNYTYLKNLGIGMERNGNRKFAMGDLDGDGKKELILNYFGDGVYEGRPVKSFIASAYTPSDNTTKIIEPFVGGNTNPQQILTCDLDGDGKDELIYIFPKGKTFRDPNNPNPSDIVFKQNVNIKTYNNFQTSIFKNFYVTITDSQTMFEGFKSGFAGDFNGDGKGELLFFDESAYYSGRFDGNTKEYSTDNIFANPINQGNENIVHLTGDFNGDGKTDLMCTYKDDRSYNTIFIYTMHADGKFYRTDFSTYPKDNPIVPDRSNTDQFDPSRLFPGDFNGDGKTDVLVATPNTANNGTFDLSIMYFTTNSFYVQNLALKPIWYSNTSLNIGDFNGDGKTDIIWYANGGPSNEPDASNWQQQHFESKIYINKGNNIFLEDANYLSINSVGNALGIQSKSEDRNGEDANYENILFADIDGNGTTDFWVGNARTGGDGGGQNSAVVLTPNYTAARSLTAVRDGLGIKTTIAYQRLVDDGTGFYTKGPDRGIANTIPIRSTPLMAVKTVSNPDGIGGLASATYAYRGGVIHTKGKGFLGFSETSVINTPSNLKSLTTYDIAATATRPNKITQTNKYVYDAANESTISTSETTIAEGAAFASSSVYNLQARSKIYYSYPSQTDTKHYQLPDDANTTPEQLSRELSQVNAFDVPSNTVRYKTTNLYNGTGTTPESSSEVFSSYSYRTINLKKILRLDQENILNTIGTESANIFTDYNYKSDASLNYKDEYKYDGVNNTNNPPTIRTQYNSRDVYGNPTSVTISTRNGNDIAPRTTSYTYDPTGRFQTQMTNALNQTSENTYDPIRGTILTHKGIDGLTTTYQYDETNRLTVETPPVGQPIYHGIYYLDNTGKTFTNNIQAGSAAVTSYFDILGRETKTTSEAFNGISNVTSKTYNNLGQVITETLPNLGAIGTATISYTYYKDGRVKAVSDSRKSTNPVVVSYTYNKHKTTTTKWNGSKHIVTSIENYVFGKPKESIDHKQGKVAYTYTAFLEPKTITTTHSDGNGITHTFAYTNGYRTSMTDPNAGTITYGYDPIGQLVWQQDANGNRTEMTYNKLGQVLTETITPGSTAALCGDVAKTKTYTYKTTGAAIGQVDQITMPNHSQGYTYDTYGRTSTSTETIFDRTFTNSYTYDPTYGRLATRTYPNNMVLTYGYNIFTGDLQTIAKDGTTIYTKNTENAFGQTIQSTYGNGIINTQAFDSNQMPTVTLSQKDNVDKYRYVTDFNPFNGNLNSRISFGKTETFGYDDLEQLTGITYNATTQSLTYADNGNIKTKYDAGTIYAYDATKKHAVTSVKNPTTPLLPSRNQNISYNSLRKVCNITERTGDATTAIYHEASFVYGLGDERIRMVYTTDKTTTTYYAGDTETEVLPTGTTTRTYIEGPDGLIAVNIESDAGTAGGLFYLHTDHLGSVNIVTNAAGNVVELHSFDAWGRRRSTTDFSYLTAFNSGFLGSRGYTFHEHLDQFGLINMNGRLYDPQLGRMLSPDPVVITNALLNFNAYSYVNNNPLKYTDPSGELAWFVIPAIMIIAGGLNVGSAALNGPISFNQGLGLFFTGALAAGAGIATGGIGGAALGGFLNSSISTGIMGGNLSQALTSGFVGALSGAVGFGAGSAVGNGIGNLALKYGVQGAVGGAAAGFTGGFVGTYFSGGSFGDMLTNGLIGAGLGAGIGGAMGFAAGAVQNVRAGNNAWTGKQVTPGRSPLSFRNSKIPSDAKPKFATEGNYTKSNMSYGRYKHRIYKRLEEIQALGEKEYYIRSTKERIDYVDFKNRTIYELKPNNPRARKEGYNQLNRYENSLRNDPTILKQYGNDPWKKVLDTY